MTTDLNTVLDIWCPVLFGISLLATSSVSMRTSSFLISAVSFSWTRMASYLLIVALFGSFGYCGNFGIVTGLIVSFTSFYCALVHYAGFVGGTAPCVNESGEQSGTPLFDRIMSRKPGAFGSGVKANRMAAAKEASGKKAFNANTYGRKAGEFKKPAKGPSTKSDITGKEAYTTTLPFHARYR